MVGYTYGRGGGSENNVEHIGWNEDNPENTQTGQKEGRDGQGEAEKRVCRRTT